MIRKAINDRHGAGALRIALTKLLQRVQLGLRFRVWLHRFLRQSFDFWQRLGLHVTPNHYYQPIPDTRQLEPSIWNTMSTLAGVDMNERAQIEMLEAIASSFRAEYARFPLSTDGALKRYYVNNGSFESVDGEVLYSMIRYFRPKRLIEVGTGWSTLLSAEAVLRNADEGYSCEFISIDPFPWGAIRSGVRGLTELIVEPVQSVPLETFDGLAANDILFIDSTHVVRIGGDVVYDLLEVLPRLKTGALVHVHDIFLPAQYPKHWVLRQKLFYTEQYLLQAFLTFNTAFEVLWAGHYMHLKHPDMLEAAFPSYRPDCYAPGSFWMRKVA